MAFSKIYSFLILAVLMCLLERVGLAEEVKQTSQNNFSSSQEFSEYLAVNALSNQALLIKLSGENEKLISIQNYVGTVFIIFTASVESDPKFIKNEVVDEIIRAMIKNEGVKGNMSVIDDPLLLLNAEEGVIQSAMGQIALPSFLAEFYQRMLDREEYRRAVTAFQTRIALVKSTP